MNELVPVLADSFATIFAALLALLTAYAIRGINAVTAKARAETDKLEDDSFRSFADEALLRVDDLATKTVTQIEQTTAKGLRELVKSGAAKREDLEELGRRAVEEIIGSLTPAYRNAITQTVGDLERYVTKAVESKVYELKNGISILSAIDAAP